MSNAATETLSVVVKREIPFPPEKTWRALAQPHLERNDDPSGLFNSSLEGNVRRAIDFHEGDEIDEDAFRTLVRAAAALNRS